MLQPRVDPKYDHVLGEHSAPVTLVEYGDFESLHCCKIYPDVKALQKEMGNELRFVFRRFPLPNRHPLSLEAAIACEIAATQDRFWDVHDHFLAPSECLSHRMIDRTVKSIELNTSLLMQEKDLVKMSRKIISDFEGAVRSGVDRAPTFFINGLRFNGSLNFNDLLSSCKYALYRHEPAFRKLKI